MNKTIQKRMLQISKKTVFETGDPNDYIRAVDVAFLLAELDKALVKNSKLESQKPEGGR